jgi:endonuclease YncB( thermonuclease family)
MRHLIILGALFLPILLVSSAFAAKFTSPVVAILDGDTFEVLHNQRPERIHLNGIDCPDKGQAYGNNAKHAASELAFGKEVTLQTHGKDKYGRTLADVLLPVASERGWSLRMIAKNVGSVYCECGAGVGARGRVKKRFGYVGGASTLR